MRLFVLAFVGAAILPAIAHAQVPPAELGQRNVPAPWWMREPVVASLGSVRAEVAANRAGFQASFSEVAKTAPEATRRAAERVRELDSELRTFGAERARLTTTFNTQPLYDQYKDKEGNLQDNRRADKIDRYQVEANVQIEVRDLAVLERVYGRVVDARPTSVGQVFFRLEPGNELNRWMLEQAVKDAAARARVASAAAGGRLGAPKVIDPSGGVCQTQVLAGWPSYVGGGTMPTMVQAPTFSNRAMVASAYAAAPAPPPPPPPPAPGSNSISVSLQPPIETLQREACVVYALLP